MPVVKGFQDLHDLTHCLMRLQGCHDRRCATSSPQGRGQPERRRAHARLGKGVRAGEGGSGGEEPRKSGVRRRMQRQGWEARRRAKVGSGAARMRCGLGVVG